MQKIINMEQMDEIQIMPGNETAEILQNIGMIVTLPLESAPMCRGLGTSREYAGKPDMAGRTLLTRDIFTAIQDQEERVTLETVDLEGNGGSGGHTAILEVNLNG